MLSKEAATRSDNIRSILFDVLQAKPSECDVHMPLSARWPISLAMATGSARKRLAGDDSVPALPWVTGAGLRGLGSRQGWDWRAASHRDWGRSD